MSNFADELALTDYYMDGPVEDFDYYEPSDEDLAEQDAYLRENDPWGDTPEFAPFASDQSLDPPF